MALLREKHFQRTQRRPQPELVHHLYKTVRNDRAQSYIFKVGTKKRMAKRELNSVETVSSLLVSSDLFGQFEYKWLNYCLIIVWLFIRILM